MQMRDLRARFNRRKRYTHILYEKQTIDYLMRTLTIYNTSIRERYSPFLVPLSLWMRFSFLWGAGTLIYIHSGTNSVWVIAAHTHTFEYIYPQQRCA